MTGRPVSADSISNPIDVLLRKFGLYREDIIYKLKNNMFKKIIENTDWNKWGKNTLIFVAPFLLVFLVSIQQGSDLKDALNLLWLFVLNTMIDLIRKFIASTK